MRHEAALVAALEGMSRPAFRIAKELAANSRSGLTVRFLSKKLELPEEEVEYLVDVNFKLLYTDLTKIRIPAEGTNVVKRISEGLENLGDVPALFRRIKSCSANDFRLLEEQIGIERPGAKKAAAEELLARFYKHPDSVVEYVATRGFADTGKELFDIVWQSKKGIIPISRLRAIHGGSDHEIEQGLWELFRGFALFEMFRFDAEERLVRFVGILSELRQHNEEKSKQKTRKIKLKPYRGTVYDEQSHGLEFSDQICRLVAAFAAKAARVRGDGELFREDRRRVEDVASEDTEPSLNTCLWVARGVGWLARVDNELRAGELEALIPLDRVARHRLVYDWLVNTPNEAASRRILTELLGELVDGKWYRTLDFVAYAMYSTADRDQSVLKSEGGHWHYVNPSASGNSERSLARSLQETLRWAGVVDCADSDDGGLFRITPLGKALLTGEGLEKIAKGYPERTTEIVVQPNFDIVVPVQDADPLLTVPLDQFTIRESSSQATIYRLSKESFVQAIQEGHDGTAFVGFLMRHNRGGELPANVMTTLDDWRGGMKRVRLRTLYVLESDDPLVIADLTHRRVFKSMLKHIDNLNVVSYTKVSKADLAKALEKEGFVVD